MFNIDEALPLPKQVEAVGEARGYQGSPMSHKAILVAERILVHIAAFGLTIEAKEAIDALMVKFSADDAKRAAILREQQARSTESARRHALVAERIPSVQTRLAALLAALKPIPATISRYSYMNRGDADQEPGTVQVGRPTAKGAPTCVFCGNSAKWAVGIGKSVAGVCGTHGREEVAISALVELIDEGALPSDAGYSAPGIRIAGNYPHAKRLLALLKSVPS